MGIGQRRWYNISEVGSNGETGMGKKDNATNELVNGLIEYSALPARVDKEKKKNLVRKCKKKNARIEITGIRSEGAIFL
jgi:hypothetical protein